MFNRAVLCRACPSLCALILFGIAGGPAAGQAIVIPPEAEITALSAQGMAPFTVHVHGLTSTPGQGDKLSARYEWNFGDPAGDYNELVGWNAAHTYDAPGQYFIELRVVNEAGGEDTQQLIVNVAPDTRSVLHVAASGSDGNPGTLEEPLRTLAAAMDLLGDDTAVLLRRGDVFDVPDDTGIYAVNCRVGAYGTGTAPVLRWTGSLGGSSIIAMNGEDTRDAVIEDIHFDSQYASFDGRDIVSALKPAGENVTVRRCSFGHVTDAINTNRIPTGVFSYDNTATDLRAYYLWGQGSDHTHVGNTVLGSDFEHNIRFSGIHRVLIAHNELRNEPKRCIWSMRGDHSYLVGNTLTDGRLTVGPDHVGGQDADRFEWSVVEQNFIDKTDASTPALEVEHGAEHVAIRNNIIVTAGNSNIAIKGWSEARHRTSVDIRIVNNTGVSSNDRCRFLWVGGDTIDVLVANNLFVAPNLVAGDYRSFNNYIEDDALDGFVGYSRNVWAEPVKFELEPDGYHYLWPYWADPEGYLSDEEWLALSGVDGDVHAVVSLDGAYAPAFDSAADGHALPRAGVFTDFYGAARPADIAWTAGAVELNSGDPIDPDPVDDGRVAEGLVVLYHFDDAGGAIVHDRSGVAPALDLLIADPELATLDGQALVVTGSTIVQSPGPALKIHQACSATNAITIEAWVVPASAGQGGPARIVTYSDGNEQRNAMLGQSSSLYKGRLRTTSTDGNGMPELSTWAGPNVTHLTHVVYTRSASGQREMYINTVRGANGPLGGDLSAWDPSMRLALANELTLDRPWFGAIHLVAVYDRALDAAEIEQNYLVGPDPTGDGPLAGDLNADGVVDEADLCAWHAAPLDLDGDGDADDADAVYLVTLMSEPPVDCNANLVPDSCEVVSESSVLVPWDDPAANFYEPVALQGTAALIGSYLDDTRGEDAGAAYFFRAAGGEWTSDGKAFAIDAAAGAQFGYAVALDGSVAIIGAPMHDAMGADAGAAYVFRRVGSAWFEDQRLLPWGGANAVNSRFGFSVDIDGDAIVVGALLDSTRGTDAGAAYVFRYNGVDWLPEAKLLPTGNATGDKFGVDVAIDGEALIVGAHLDDALGTDSGSATVHRRVGLEWLAEQTLLPATGTADDRAGRAVAIHGDTALVGSMNHDVQAENAGAASLYHFDGAAWYEVALLTAPDGSANDRFGRAVDLGGSAIVVGAYQDDDGGLDAGSAYVFPIVNELLLDPVKLRGGGGGVVDAFGCAVDLDHTALVVAAPGGSVIEAYVYSDIGALDGDGNGVPDECEDLPADINGDGVVDGQDLLALLSNWGECASPPAPCPADLTGDGLVDDADLELFYEYW